MVVKKENLKKNCFKCKKIIIVKYNYPQKQYSKKNNWGWWTEKKENVDKYICDSCLENLYYKNKTDYLENITNETKRNTLRKYMYESRK